MSRASPSNAKALGQTRANARSADHEGHEQLTTPHPQQLDLLGYQPPAKIDGATYEAKHDGPRLIPGREMVARVMTRYGWLTLEEIQLHVSKDYGKHISLTSVSARVRDCRKASGGGHRVERRRRGDPRNGVHEYRLVPRST